MRVSGGVTLQSVSSRVFCRIFGESEKSFLVYGQSLPCTGKFIGSRTICSNVDGTVQIANHAHLSEAQKINTSRHRKRTVNLHKPNLRNMSLGFTMEGVQEGFKQYGTTEAREILQKSAKISEFAESGSSVQGIQESYGYTVVFPESEQMNNNVNNLKTGEQNGRHRATKSDCCAVSQDEMSAPRGLMYPVLGKFVSALSSALLEYPIPEGAYQQSRLFHSKAQTMQQNNVDFAKSERNVLLTDIERDYEESMSHIQGPQGPVGSTIQNVVPLDVPCPQGIQGNDCVRFKLWLKNCHKYGMENCEEQMKHLTAGRKTLNEIFAEHELAIKEVVDKKHLVDVGEVGYDTQSYAKHDVLTNTEREYVENTPDIQGQQGPVPETGAQSDNQQLSQIDKLRMAVRDYGSTVIVFHVGISLASLGGCYMAVSSGIDMVGLLSKIEMLDTFFQSKIAAGASTFLVAYAVHKVFAPVRIGITLTATPFIVTYLRRIGFLRPPKK